MIQFLLTEKLDWVNAKDLNLDNYSDHIPIGYFLAVGLEYPDESPDLRNDYPLADEKIEVTKEILPDYQLQIIEHNNFSLGKNKKTYS